MSEDFTVEFKGRYIYISNRPDLEITARTMDTLWTILSQATKKYGCLKVLAEGSVTKRAMGTMDAFRSGDQAALNIPGLAMACCLYGYKTDETTQFFKNVAHNRGARIEFFTNKEKALQWLGFDDTD